MLEICEIGGAVATADDPNMKIDVVGPIGSQRPQDVAPQLPSGGTAHPVTPPHATNGKRPGGVAVADVRNPLPERGRVAQLAFEERHPLRGKRFVEVTHQFLIGPFARHDYSLDMIGVPRIAKVTRPARRGVPDATVPDLRRGEIRRFVSMTVRDFACRH